jgi:hypothetical protein
LPAGEGDKHFVPALGAADTGEAEVEVAAGEEFADDLTDDRAPWAVTLLGTLVVGPFEFENDACLRFGKAGKVVVVVQCCRRCLNVCSGH